MGTVAKAVDLRRLASDEYGRRDLTTAGLKELGRVVLEKEVEKPRWVTMSRWDNRLPTAEQGCFYVF